MIQHAQRLLHQLAGAIILPDIEAGVLTIQVHSMANPRANRAIEYLLEYLDDSQFNYPGTNLQLVYRIAAPSSISRENH